MRPSQEETAAKDGADKIREALDGGKRLTSHEVRDMYGWTSQKFWRACQYIRTYPLQGETFTYDPHAKTFLLEVDKARADTYTVHRLRHAVSQMESLLTGTLRPALEFFPNAKLLKLAVGAAEFTVTALRMAAPQLEPQEQESLEPVARS